MAKLNKSKKDKELYWYTNKKGEKLWMYRHKYEDIFGNRREKKKSSFETEGAALKALLKVKSDLLNGNEKQVEKDKMTVAQWMDIWYETHKNEWKEPTQNQRAFIIDTYIKPFLGNKVLIDLDKSAYKLSFINALLAKGFKPSTIGLYHTMFKTAVNAAVDDEFIPRNRFNKIVIPQDDEEDEDEDIDGNYLSAEELNKLLDFSEEHSNLTNYNLMLTLAYTGLRKGEALGLQWNEVDFKAKTIRVRRTRDQTSVRPPKTKNSYRTIPVDDIVFSQLKKYKVWCKKHLLRKGKHLKDEDFVFISTQGNPITNSTVNRNFKNLIEKGNLKSITVHGLRHTHATILLNRGTPTKVIADRLGNTPKMIDEVYGHVLEESKDQTVKVFSESLGAKSGAN